MIPWQRYNKKALLSRVLRNIFSRCISNCCDFIFTIQYVIVNLIGRFFAGLWRKIVFLWCRFTAVDFQDFVPVGGVVL